jgi:hypothetical protein
MVIIAGRRSTWLVVSGRSRLSGVDEFMPTTIFVRMEV